ncbi:MAG TPA: AMP-binding protein [Thermodesulfobacteriota bacterium]|nr:AMP-binding protein [Thermodesulfobacteriota bacterium]
MEKFTKPVRKIPTVRPGLGIRTIPEMVGISGEKYSSDIAYLTPRGSNIYKLSYGQVLEYVKRLGRHLKERGVEKGDNIAILGENRPEWGISYFSVTWIGATVIPLDARASLDFYKAALKFSSAKAIILSGSYLSEIESIYDQLDELKHIILMDNLDKICSKFANGVGMGDVSPDDILEILFTSGTTGDPKGVMLTHRNILSNVDDIYKIIELYPDDRAFSILPIHHSYECTAGLITPFYNGLSVFYARSLKPNEMTEDLRVAQPTMWLNTPLILEKLYLRITRELSKQKGFKGLVTKALPKKIIGSQVKKKMGLHRIRFILSGGAALPHWVSRELEEFGFPLIQGYGLSEASPLISVSPPSNPNNKSVGMIIPSDEAEIRDIDAEGNGEIVVTGPNIMRGYYKNESATKEALTTDGWLMTGDVGYFDGEGYLYVTGRKKSIIVTRGGKNVFPEEIEEKLIKSPYIEEVLVFSPDDESIQAIIHPNIDEVRTNLQNVGKEVNDDNVWEFIKSEVRNVNETLEIYKRIRHFAIRYEEFPKTTTRKVKRHLFKNINLTRETKVVRN